MPEINPAALRVIHLPSIAANRSVALAAARASCGLVDRFGLRWSLDRWDQPAFAAFCDRTAVGFLQFKKDEVMSSVEVTLAWCSPQHPRALVLLAGAVRRWARDHSVRELAFCYHHGNQQMERLAEIVGARIVSHTCMVEFGRDPADA